MRFVFSQAVVFRAAVLWTCISTVGLGYLLGQNPITHSWFEISPLVGQWAWPILSFPHSFGAVPYFFVFVVKALLLVTLWNTRHIASTWWWVALDGALTLVLSASDLATFCTYWPMANFLALLCLSRQMQAPTDEVSNNLARLITIGALSQALILFSLVSGPSHASPVHGLFFWVGILLQTIGSVYQAMETNDRQFKRVALLGTVIGFCVPATLLVSRYQPAVGIDYLCELLTLLVLTGGIVSFQSRTFESLLKGIFITAQSSLLLAVSLKVAPSYLQLALHFSPFLILGGLLARIPSFVMPERAVWIRCLEGPLRRTTAAGAMLMVALLIGSSPFGLTGFPFHALLALSPIWAGLFCLGVLSTVAGSLTVLVGYWFSDPFFKWPTKTYAVLARRYFGV
jgi:hypothetical protein